MKVNKGTIELKKILKEVEETTPEEFMKVYNKAKTINHLNELIIFTDNMTQEEFDKKDKETDYRGSQLMPTDLDGVSIKTSKKLTRKWKREHNKRVLRARVKFIIKACKRLLLD